MKPSILILSKVSLPGLNRYLPHWPELPEEKASIFITEDCPKSLPFGKPQAIVCMSISVLNAAQEACARWPGVPLFIYHWDAYSWVTESPRPGEYNYGRYRELMEEAVEIWTPSRATQDQLRQTWGLSSIVVYSAVPRWQDQAWCSARDQAYALCSLRRLPDRHVGWFERACAELDIPYVMMNHGLSQKNYQSMVLGARLLVSHYEEASTGGLTLLEAARFGIPSLVFDGPYNGAKEYLGEAARTFKNYWELKSRLADMYFHPYRVDGSFVSKFSDRNMALAILERIHANLGTTTG
jgi:hypothetical protein